MPVAQIAPPARAAGSDFTPLKQAVQAHGLLDRRRRHYTANIAATIVLLAAAWSAVGWLGNTWWQLLLAVPAALLTIRTTFFGHDACHQQIARTRPVNHAIGLVLGNLLVGMSYGWWADKHNRHHANPNHTDKDPDVGVGILAWTEAQAAGRRGIGGWFIRHQAQLFFPLLTLEGINLKVSSVRYLLRRQQSGRALECVLLAIHLAGYLTLPFLVMSPGKAVAFLLLHQALIGLHLGAAFAPNHKGMPMPEPGVRWGHLQRQVLTSRNVRGGVVVDWLLGGLNYQVEHHLFPNLPRPNLHRAQPLVRAHCESVGIPYTETGLLDSYRQALRHMHRVGRLRPARRSS
jgi:fatty acid desaturase